MFESAIPLAPARTTRLVWIVCPWNERDTMDGTDESTRSTLSLAKPCRDTHTSLDSQLSLMSSLHTNTSIV